MKEFFLWMVLLNLTLIPFWWTPRESFWDGSPWTPTSRDPRTGYIQYILPHHTLHPSHPPPPHPHPPWTRSSHPRQCCPRSRASTQFRKLDFSHIFRVIPSKNQNKKKTLQRCCICYNGYSWYISKIFKWNISVISNIIWQNLILLRNYN